MYVNINYMIPNLIKICQQASKEHVFRSIHFHSLELQARLKTICYWHGNCVLKRRCIGCRVDLRIRRVNILMLG